MQLKYNVKFYWLLLRAGDDWGDGSNCGSRARHGNAGCSVVSTHSGCREQ